MNFKDPDDVLTARINIKCHPELLKKVKALSKKYGILGYSTLIRMWLYAAVEKEELTIGMNRENRLSTENVDN